MIKQLLTFLLAAGSLWAADNNAGRISAPEFSIEKGFYKDKSQWLAVNPEWAKSGTASLVFPYRDGVYDLVLEMVGENDGQSVFELAVESRNLGRAVCPISPVPFETGSKYNWVWKNVNINDGDLIRVKGSVASIDGKEWSRARWAAVQFRAVDGGDALSADFVDQKSLTPVPLLHGIRRKDGTGRVKISGELKQWHKVTLTLDGPYAHELDNAPNPFADRQMDVVFTHESGSPEYKVPGYFAADGNAAETSADCGTQWRAHLSPDKIGQWSYRISFENTKYDGQSGTFTVAATDKRGRDLRGKGRLQYVGKRYLQFAGSKEWFLKAGADAPETLLGYADFDNTVANKSSVPLKTWEAHVRDWRAGDPVWQGNKGKGLIGAINYLAAEGMNAFSFLTYNAGGDGDNVWPHVSRSDKLHFDCSKLDQWGRVFDHGTKQGMYLHFKLQETENDDLRGKNKAGIRQSLNGGKLGPERKAYLREMIARFGHNLALNWNMGEENTQSEKELLSMAEYIRATDPYGHNLVLHTYPNQQDQIYGWFVGRKDVLSGTSLQNSNVARTHKDTLKWVTRSEKSGHPWVVAFDEAGSAGTGTPPDPDWPGMAQAAKACGKKDNVPSLATIRAEVLWGTLMAGGTGVEYYFGYRLPENDLLAENWRSRERTWGYSRIALNFFPENKVPFWKMTNANTLIGNFENSNTNYCLAAPGQEYLVYLRQPNQALLDLSQTTGAFKVSWFNPREGGALQEGSISQVRAGGMVKLGVPPTDDGMDWVVLIRRIP